ncbi:hypothetical protein [Asticcacaulis benevestitus]|uniref:Alkaline proteinase inhibitor/ Outer membrane lipoprotein Omp19 domain-containing protein n=1 Tax=Asticcacaulis benevestitus DSM 16100 = ATCC BAA-896 TaxID=1121022 RepID=V4PSY2_9CAUL|nr:hypothetical protein [Asticcacaulis benevestitus]ESQ90479.1 hypothetical protein ABENE_12210 [Asticcacaulis benevestitus DSM 16100 = ATCC BAA-896]
MRRFTELVLTGLCLMGGAAYAAPKPDLTPRPGAWRLEGASEGEPVCLLRLMATETIGGKDVVSDACHEAYPWTADITAWYAAPGTHGDMTLIDGERRVVIRFSLVDGDPAYDGATQGFDYALYPPLPVRAAEKAKKAHK